MAPGCSQLPQWSSSPTLGSHTEDSVKGTDLALIHTWQDCSYFKAITVWLWREPWSSDEIAVGEGGGWHFSTGRQEKANGQGLKWAHWVVPLLKKQLGDTTAMKNRIQFAWTTGFLARTWGTEVTELLKKMSQAHITSIFLPGFSLSLC